MAEADDLKKAHGLITAGRKDLALALLQKSIASKDVNMRVDAGLALLVALDHLTQTRELLKVTDKTRCDAAAAGNSDVHAYLLSKKAELLSNKVSGLAGERRNLNLASLFPRILGDGLWISTARGSKQWITNVFIGMAWFAPAEVFISNRVVSCTRNR